MGGARYRNSSNKCVNRCTGIIDLLGFNKSMLINWAKSLGDEAKKVSDKATGIGTYVHNVLEAYVYGTEIDPELKSNATFEEILVAERGLDSYKRWEDTNQPEYLESEYVIISEEGNWGGTADLLVKVNGGIYLADFKTSKGVYREHLIQLHAYQGGIREMSYYDQNTITALQENNSTHHMNIVDYRNIADGAFVFHIQKDFKDINNEEVFVPHFIPQQWLNEAGKDWQIALELNQRRTTFNKFLKEINDA